MKCRCHPSWLIPRGFPLGTLFCQRMPLVLFLAAGLGHIAVPDVAAEPGSIEVDFQGRPQEVRYDYYVPPVVKGEKLPVLVCVGGLPIIDGKPIHSDPGECLDEGWKRFADDTGLAILGLGFLFVDADWPLRQSYQFPAAWSGRALGEVLEMLEKAHPIDPQKLFFFGMSAGSQFGVRYAQLDPDRAVAVAAHAAGGYDRPGSFIPPRFLITVGELDNTEISRLEMAQKFVGDCAARGIDARLVIIPGIGHTLTEGQTLMSREFFRDALIRGARAPSVPDGQ